MVLIWLRWYYRAWFRATQRAVVSGLLAGRWFHLPVRQKLGVNEGHIEKLLEAVH